MSNEVAKLGYLTAPLRSRLSRRFALSATFLSRARKQAKMSLREGSALRDIGGNENVLDGRWE